MPEDSLAPWDRLQGIEMGEATNRPRIAEGLFSTLKHRCQRFVPAFAWEVLRRWWRPVELAYLQCRMRRLVSTKLPASIRRKFLRMVRDAEIAEKSKTPNLDGEVVMLPVRGSNLSVKARVGTSDVLVYYQVFAEEQYSRFNPSVVNTVVDCGANVGYSSIYFLQKYPLARIFALEPDPVNFKMCLSNLEAFGSRARIIRAALSDRSRALRIDKAYIGTWASRTLVDDCKGEGVSVTGLDIQTLMNQEGIHEIDILKVDIEGAELEVFQARDLSWLDRVNTIQIELHGRTCQAAFLSAIEGRGFRLAHYGEVFTATRDGVRPR